eukprot:g8529.t1
MGPANSSTANSLLTTIFTDDSEDTYWVTIHKGLEGDQVEVPLTPRMPYAQMEQILLTQMSADPTLSVILSADGQTIDSSAQLIECHQQDGVRNKPDLCHAGGLGTKNATAEGGRGVPEQKVVGLSD